MNFVEIVKNTTYYLEIFITDSQGSPVTGLSVTYAIYKSFDNSLVISGSMIEIGNGVYQKPYTFNNVGQFRAIYITPNNYTDEIETVVVVDQHALESTLIRTLGLAQENYRIFDTFYDNLNNMTSATIKIYPTAMDVDADTNAIAEYEVSATYNGQGKMSGYKVKKQ